MTNKPKDIIKEKETLSCITRKKIPWIDDLLTQARADERKKVGKELLGYFLGENNKKVELAIREITGEKL